MEGGQFSPFPGGEPEWEAYQGTPREGLLTPGDDTVGLNLPQSRRGREVADLISAESRAAGRNLVFPEKIIDPAWLEPERFEQDPPFQEVCPRRLLHAMRVTDLDVPAELCTDSRIDVSGQWTLRISHRAVFLLRRSAIQSGLAMDDGGWVLLRHLANRLHVQPGVLIMIAAGDDKGRFQLAHYAPAGRPSSTVLIRAKQGHSIEGLRDERLYVSPLSPQDA